MEVAEKTYSMRARGRLHDLSTTHEGVAKSFDGTRISYRSAGGGFPPIVCCNGLGVSTIFWNSLEKHMRHECQVVTWDYRGHGHSENPRVAKNHTIDSLVLDCKAVFDALKLEKAVLIGHSMGTQVIFEFYRRFPKRVAGLIPCLGTYGHPIDTFYDTRISRYVFNLINFMGTRFPREARVLRLLLLKNPLAFWLGGLLGVQNPLMADRKAADAYLEHIVKMDPQFWSELAQSIQQHSAEDILTKIKCPTLIIAGEKDTFTPAWISKKMERLIPDAELFEVRKGTHSALIEQPQLINMRIEKFLNDRVR